MDNSSDEIDNTILIRHYDEVEYIEVTPNIKKKRESLKKRFLKLINEAKDYYSRDELLLELQNLIID